MKIIILFLILLFAGCYTREEAIENDAAYVSGVRELRDSLKSYGKDVWRKSYELDSLKRNK